MGGLVLSLFPGIGLLDMAFEEEGFCVVRGPDVLWGGDVRDFHPPRGRFDGAIGGPPCQFASRATIRRESTVNLIPEFCRVVEEAAPAWFLMENVEGAPLPRVAGYTVDSTLLDNRSFGAEQHRVRRFSLGSRAGLALGRHLQFVALENPHWEYTVLASDTPLPGQRKRGIGYRTWQDCARLQGLPKDFDLPPFRVDAKTQAIGNGVPLPMGRAVARAIKAALTQQEKAA
jgi:DNA (cytosine-5)-methyltransferase 1